ncbi:hypothetical protein D3C75_785280 [compost metagenome]
MPLRAGGQRLQFGGGQRRRWRAGQADGEEDLGFLHFGLGALAGGELGQAVDAGQLRQAAAADLRLLGQRPAQRGSGVAQGASGVAGIELAVAEGAFAVLPGLAPHHRGEQHGQTRAAAGGRVTGAQLEGVAFRAVVVEAVDQAVDAAEQQVGLDGVQVAAGGIGAQRPAVRAVALPGGEAER